MLSLVKRINFHLGQIYLSLIRNIDGGVGNYLRQRYYQKRLRHMGENVLIDTGVYMYNMDKISIGSGTHIDKGCIIVASPSNLDLSHRAIQTKNNEDIKINRGELIIGNNCHIAQHCMIFSYGGVKIGDQCVLSTGCKIYSLSSLPINPHDPGKSSSLMPYSGESPTVIGPVELEYNCWAGINVVILPGVKIKQDSFIRTNSVVKNSCESNSYIAGDPAQYKRPRFGVKIDE